jgi:CheY-like chemotaxis protein
MSDSSAPPTASSADLEAIGLFAIEMAHDINNALTVIRCCAELLELDQNLCPMSRRQTERVAGAARRAAKMTKDLMTFANARGIEPVLRPSATAPAPTAAPPGAEPAPERARILLVEDDAPIREVVAFTLRRRGYTVTAADGTTAALAAAEAGTFDLMITDLMMPVMNGRALADKLVVSHPDMHILFTSGHARRSLHSGLLRPEDHLLTKPFNMDSLTRVVGEILNESGS